MVSQECGSIRKQLCNLRRACEERQGHGDRQTFSVIEMLRRWASKPIAESHEWAKIMLPVMEAALHSEPEQPDHSSDAKDLTLRVTETRGEKFTCEKCGGHLCEKRLDGSLRCLGAGVVYFTGCNSAVDHSGDVNKKVEPAPTPTNSPEADAIISFIEGMRRFSRRLVSMRDQMPTADDLLLSLVDMATEMADTAEAELRNGDVEAAKTAKKGLVSDE